jgi:hypothetical protein
VLVFEEENEIDDIYITLTNYTTFNDDKKIFVDLKGKTYDRNTFNDSVKTYLNKENIDKKLNR